MLAAASALDLVSLAQARLGGMANGPFAAPLRAIVIPKAAPQAHTSTSTAYPSSYTLPLRTLTLLVVGLASAEAEKGVSFADVAVSSHPFRPGSGASVSQPSSRARATTLPDGPSLEPLLVNAIEDGVKAHVFERPGRLVLGLDEDASW